MAVHDNYEKDILKQLKRIANSLEAIEKKLPNMWWSVDTDCSSSDKQISMGEPMKE